MLLDDWEAVGEGQQETGRFIIYALIWMVYRVIMKISDNYENRCLLAEVLSIL